MPSETTVDEESRRAPAWRRLGHLPLSRRAELVGTGFLLIAAGMVPWTVFLGLSLPPRYDAGHWDLLWTGFDIGLILVLSYAAWAAWFHRQIVAATAIVSGTLLLCDAWFDIITSLGHRDEWVTMFTGLAGELPLAVFFFWFYRKIVLASLATFHARLGDGEVPRRLREAQVLFLARREKPSLVGQPSGYPVGAGDTVRNPKSSFTVRWSELESTSLAPPPEIAEE
jgi:hypothetical protein